MKIVINACYGGFGLSDEAYHFFAEKLNDEWINEFDLRTNPLFIQKVEENSQWVSNDYSKLRVVEIPNGATDWSIDEYDGLERIVYVLNGKINYVH